MRVLNLSDFPGCCKALVLHGFGQCNHDDIVYEQEVIEEDIREAIRIARRDGHAFLIAITTTDQERANNLLWQAGFGRNKNWAEKGGPNAGNCQLRIWYYYVQHGPLR